jgi:hypothetical protein
MKNNNFFKYIVFAGLTLFSTACSSDFLEVDPFGKSDTKTYYSTDEEVSYALTAAYDMLHSDQLQGWSSAFFIKQLPADDTNCGGGGESDQSQYQKIDDFKWEPENAGIKAYYSTNYYGVYRCNQLINNAKSDTPLKKRMIAEAKFLRAYFYFELTTAFGDVPLRLEAAKTLTEGMARTPQAQIYTQIAKDLNEAIADLPNKTAYAAADKFRVSKQAAQALLGKTYLFAKDYPKASIAFKSVIDKEGTEVGLISDFSKITRAESEFGKESLLEASFISENKNWGNANWDRNADDNRHLQLSGPRGPFTSGTSGIRDGWGFNPPTMKLYNAFAVTDTRRAATVITKQELASKFNGEFNDGWDTEGCVRTKYTTYFAETSDLNGNTPELNYSTNWRLIRYADVLLMAAEAYQKQGKDLEARIELNKIRTRAGMPAITLSGDALFTAIVKERQVELAYEGLRYWDLVRWGLAQQELSTIGFVKGKHEHFPIPLDEINGNVLIGTSNQNPGY